MTKQQARFLIALADKNLNVTDAAKSVFYHRNTMNYHLAKIRKETGLDARQFYDMCKLLPLAQAVLDEADT